MTLSGKNALVTGSAQGIGQAIAVRLAQEGADVVINDRANLQGAQETQARIQQMGRKASIVEADISNAADLQKMFEQAVGALGSIEILVNNAGVEKNAGVLDVTREDYQRVIDIDMTAPFFLTQTFARHRRDRGQSGKVINISSVHEELPFPHFTAYCMAKGGLKMMTRNLSIELAPLGITINNIAPGAIETPINSKLLNDPKLLQPAAGEYPAAPLGQT